MTLRILPLVMLASAAALVTACSGAEVPSTTPLASPTVLTSPIPLASNTPFPIPSTSLTEANLKYALLDRFGPISWCDPDFYPVAHADEQVLAKQRLPDIQADTSTYTAILEHLGIEEGSDLTDGDTLAVYREWKLLNAVHLEPAGDRGAAFDLITITDEGLGRGVHTGGSISAEGTIDIDVQEETFLTSCPICLARGTLIDTPDGGVLVERLRPGDMVWSVDDAGRRVVAPLLKTGSAPVSSDHQLVHLVLGDGRELWVSPGHPLTDGRVAGDLKPNDILDGARVRTVDLVSYAGGVTFDLLPGSATGFYWANGILIASTLT